MTEIPGYVALSTYDDRGDDNAHSLNWKLLREAAISGEVDGFQHGKSRRWLVHKAQADAFIAARSRRAVEVTVRSQGGEVDVTTLGAEQSLGTGIFGLDAALTLARIEGILEQILHKMGDAEGEETWPPEDGRLPG
jgi:hypothetical protein